MHKRLHRLQLPRRNRLLCCVRQLNKTIWQREMAARTELVYNSSAADWLWLKTTLQTLNYPAWLVPLCPLGTFFSIRLMCCLNNFGQSGQFSFARTCTGKPQTYWSAGFGMSASFCFSTISVNTDMITPTEGVIRIMTIATTTDNQETSFRIHFTVHP